MENSTHRHDYEIVGNYEVCKICQKKILHIKSDGQAIREYKDGTTRKYFVREHRMAWFTPDVWNLVFNKLKSEKAKRTAEILIQTGCRINEGRHVEEYDLDADRNLLTLRITKRKARKQEHKSKPRTIPINEDYAKRLKRYLVKEKKINILSTSAFNTALKKAIAEVNDPRVRPEMFSAHSIRKTHGNWLKNLGNLGMCKVDATEICLRLGHDYQTYLRDYGSSGSFTPLDAVTAKKILGGLYA